MGLCCPIDGTLAGRWEDSRVRDKLSCVLWVPVLSERSLLSLSACSRCFGKWTSRPSKPSPATGESSQTLYAWAVLMRSTRGAELGSSFALRPQTVE